jgi:NAD(P)-dependent dehydrogenase (short-subunit alcohol dehydrogenase family)
LLQEGFVVFCGCLRKESLKGFENQALAIPILLDVTKDSDVDQASKEVSKWLSGGEGRYLHALVNNAGIGITGLVDWTSMGEFQKMIDVNFMGMARCTKKFLPHFKEQATKGTYSSARIVNMVSMAGLVAGGGLSVGYEASKHAAEVFTTNLRQEMKSFGLKVTVINPSFHKTPLTKDMTADLRRKWKSLPAAKRKECGGEGMLPIWFSPLHRPSLTVFVSFIYRVLQTDSTICQGRI